MFQLPSASKTDLSCFRHKHAFNCRKRLSGDAETERSQLVVSLVGVSEMNDRPSRSVKGQKLLKLLNQGGNISNSKV